MFWYKLQTFSMLLMFAYAYLQLNTFNCGFKGPSLSMESGEQHTLTNSSLGQVVGPHEFPWQAFLELVNISGNWCAATILAANWAITSAHCVINILDNTKFPASKFKFIAGLYDLNNKSESSRKVVRVEEVFPFPAYNPTLSEKFDIALLKLAQELPFNDPSAYLSPICIPNESLDDNLDALAGKTCTVTGWDEINPDNLDLEQNLPRKINQPIWKQSTCKDAYAAVNATDMVSWDKICSGGKNRSTCGMISGGPLICYDNYSFKWTLQGIVSGIFPRRCDKPGMPDLNIRVDKFVQWIKETILYSN